MSDDVLKKLLIDVAKYFELDISSAIDEKILATLILEKTQFIRNKQQKSGYK